MKRILVAMVAVCGAMVGTGCVGRTCSSDADCQGGGVCDQASQLCVISDGGEIDAGPGDAGVDGGPADAGPTDAGPPEDGGSDSGVDGGDDAGVDAGPVATCSVTCAEWEGCEATVDGGVCHPLTLGFVAPDAGAEFAAGGQVGVKVTAVEWDGGAATVPLWVNHVAAGSIASQTEVVKTLADSGTYVIEAGWGDGGPLVARTVYASGCEAVTCADWQECVATRAGGTCVDLGLQLGWQQPVADAGFGPGAAQVSLVLGVTRADGGAYVKDVPYTLVGQASGVLVKSGSVWVGVVDAGSADGRRTLVAGWAGGPDVGTGFDVIATPPTVVLNAQAAPARGVDDTDADGVARWKKYEVVPVQVESNRALVVSPTDFSVGGVARLSASQCTTLTCATGHSCYCFGIDLAQQALAAATGNVTVQLNSVKDVYGNATTGVIPAVSLPVTRFKWMKTFPVAGGTPTAVALDSNGNIYAGASTSLSSTLVAFAADGGTQWSYSAADRAITAGPMAGSQAVYFATGTGASIAIQRVGLDGSAKTDLCSVNTSYGYGGDMALLNPGSGEVPLVVRSDGALSPGTTGCLSTAATPPLDFGGGDRPTLAVLANNIFVGVSTSATISRLTWGTSSAASSGSTSTGTLFPSNLFTVGTNLVGGGGGGGPTVGGVFAFIDGASLASTTANATPGAKPGGSAVVGPSGTSSPVVYGDSAGILRRVALDSMPGFGTATTSAPAGTSLAKRAPLLGKGGLTYVIGLDGLVRVYDSSLGQIWSWAPPATLTSISQLNLDYNRDVANPCAVGEPGVLYFAATSGTTTKLYALLVDSAGLEPQAAWPRYQHNPANTGNAATGLSSWTCP